MTKMIDALLSKGVRMPNPASVEIGPEVELSQISSHGVVIHPGCRIRGKRTVLSAGVELGREGPVTIEDCQLGERVRLAGGYASRAVFLDRSNLGLGHHVREGSLLEEEASGAHTVGLKQTILFPFVTLGSLINFCDAFMAGGTSRSDHSEVGSSYIHFNFTPSGDKTTPSMFGDVARGVMLREHPIFLGGQGGAVGPLFVNYGNVVGAGSVLRSDIEDEDRLTLVAPPQSMSRPYAREGYRRLWPMVAKNLTYLANLDALAAWYRHARGPFFENQEFGVLMLRGALAALASARAERISRLRKLSAKLTEPSHKVLAQRMNEVAAVFGERTDEPDADVVAALSAADGSGAAVLAALGAKARARMDYISAVRSLDDSQAAAATAWLCRIIAARLTAAVALLPALRRR